MIKKILACIFGLFVFVDAFAASSTVYLDTEQKYIFTSENLVQTIPEFVEDEKKQTAMAQTYQKVMNQENGAVSISNLFEVCRAGGFNTYRQSGYDQCRNFVLRLLENAEQEAEEGFLGGFCPGLDENGKNPNKLQSITDKTRIGDFCSSSHIAGGEVVFKKEYNCTCAAYACNPGYESKGGACVTRVADENGNCLRKEYSNVGNLSEPGAALKFCEGKAVKGCKVINAIKNFPSPGKVVCNATQDELGGVKARNTACPMAAYPENSENNTVAKCQSFCRAKAQENNCKSTNVIMQHSKKQCVCNPNERSYAASNLYKEVCGKDKGKTGKKEYCVTDFFNWTQTQIGQAMGFAQDYARIKHGNTVTCSNSHRKSGNDDFVKCVTKDNSVYYEFKFDDVLESVDADRRLSERSALCRLAGGNPTSLNDNKVCKGINSAAACKSLITLAQKYGHTVKWENDKCNFVGGLNAEVMKTDAFNESLAKIEGLDNRAFFELQVVSIRKNFVLEDEIEKYVKSKIQGVKKVTCDPGYRTVKVADGVLARVTGNSDDIKRCYVDGKPIDFVFNDLSEIMNYQRKAGESGAKCISNNGKFDGHYCRGLTKSECMELEKKLAAELKTRGWAGDGDLVDWDERAGACELNAAQFARNLNKTGEYVAIAGLTIGGVFTGGTTTTLAIGLMATELAGMAGEIYTMRKKELLPQQWATDFLKASRSCKSASCAETTLRSNFGKISQVSEQLNRDVLGQVDDELARLAELLPEDRLAEILNNPNSPNCWETWECQEKIFMGMQFASLGVAVGKALVKLPKVLARKFGSAATRNTGKTAASAGRSADDAAIALREPTGGGNGGAGGAGRGAGETGHGAGNADDAFNSGARNGGNGSGNGGGSNGTGGRATGNTGNTGGAGNADDAFNSGARNGGNGSGTGNGGGSNGTGGRSTGNTGNTGGGSGASGSGTNGVEIHPDLQAVRSSADVKAKRRLLQQYAADKVDKYRSKELTDLATDIQQKLENVDRMSDAELAALSRQMREFDDAVEVAEEAYRAAVAAEEAERMAKKVADISKKINRDFDKIVDDIKSGKQPSYITMKSSLNNEEWELLKESLKKEGLEVVNFDNSGFQVVIRKVGTSGRAAESAADASRVAEEAANQAKSVYNSVFHGKLNSYTKAKWEYKSAAESGLKRGNYRLNVSGMSDSEINVVQNKLRYSGVANKAEFVNTNNGRFLVIYEDDITNLGSGVDVSGSMMKNYYSGANNVENLQAKVEKILSTDYTKKEEALRQAWHDSGAWNMNEAHRLAGDLRAGIMQDIRKNPDLVSRIKKYNSLSVAEKENLWADINYIVGGQNRVHSGNTVLGFVDDSDFIAANKKSFYGGYNGDGVENMFRYNRNRLQDFDSMLGGVVHENTHGFQEVGRTAITQDGWKYRSYNYNSNGGSAGYDNQLVEMESRFMQEHVSKGFLSELLQSL